MIQRALLSFFFLSLAAVVAPPATAQSGRSKGPPVKPPVVDGPLESSPTQNTAEPEPALPTEVDGERIYRGKELDQKVRVTRKPEPSYSKEAKKRAIEGTVVLRCIFDSKGQVTHMRVVSGLPYGLIDRAIDAAKRIRFTPGLKDGHPVSMWMELQYNFNLY